MGAPRPPRSNPRFADYHDQVMRRDLRICGWLGMGPDRVFKLVDEDPNEYGEVEVWWESMAPELPTRGTVIKTGARGTWGEPTIHSGTLVLHPVDAGEMLEVAGPKPQMFTPDECRQLEGLRAGERLFEGDRVYVGEDGTVRWAGNAPDLELGK